MRDILIETKTEKMTLTLSKGLGTSFEVHIAYPPCGDVFVDDFPDFYQAVLYYTQLFLDECTR